VKRYGDSMGRNGVNKKILRFPDVDIERHIKNKVKYTCMYMYIVQTL